MNSIFLTIGIFIFTAPFICAFFETIKIYFFHKNSGQCVPFWCFMKNDLGFEILMALKAWMIVWITYLIVIVIYLGVVYV